LRRSRINLNVIEEVMDFLAKSFDTKDLGVADVILNTKLLREENGGVTLVQSHYVEKAIVTLVILTASPFPLCQSFQPW
jgi:hypothetical protein